MLAKPLRLRLQPQTRDTPPPREADLDRLVLVSLDKFLDPNLIQIQPQI